jgi:hypothetical protein
VPSMAAAVAPCTPYAVVVGPPRRSTMTKQGARDHWGRYIQGMMDERIAPSEPPPGPARARRGPPPRDAAQGSAAGGQPS